jgi:RHS repeat-associated protein
VFVFRYTDKELDTDTDLYYFQARYYDPVRGGFPSRDKVKLEDNLKNYFGINAYVFTNNNPVRNVDPDGNRGVMIQSGTEYVVNPVDGYKYYRTDIYPNMRPTAGDIANIKSPISQIKPSTTVWLSRDAKGTIEHPDLYGSEQGTGEFGTNKEAPNMIYTLSPIRKNLANSSTDKILLTGATSEWGSGEAVEKIPYRPRTGLTIETYSPEYSLGCLQTGFDKKTISTIKNELPDYMNPLDPAYLIKE